MAQDRFVFWEDKKGPSVEQIGCALTDFLGEFAVDVSYERSRYTAKLAGQQSNPYRRIGPEIAPGVNLGSTWAEGGERWIEVFIHEYGVDVITRMADPATCALANELAQILARRWKGKLAQ